MGTLKVLAVVCWVALGIFNLKIQKEKINKADYFICWVLLVMYLTKEAVFYFISN